MAELTRFADGLFFPEGPRWHDGYLWVSDVTARTVRRYKEDGSGEDFVRLDTEVLGLGFAADGRVFVVDMPGRRLLAVRDGVTEVVADLAGYAPSFCNDLVVASDGTAYVTHLGANHWKGETLRAVPIIRVRPDGTVHNIGPDLLGPNGIVLTPDERTLLIAEPGGGRVCYLRLDDTGEVIEHGVHTSLSPAPSSGLPFGTPDGICLDADGGLWIADPTGARVVRVDSKGELTDVVPVEGGIPLAVVLGGARRTTLYVAATANIDFYAPPIDPTGFIGAVTVAVPGLE